ncbi:MAG: TonB-dependent receptor [Dysgonamonadaceae bacterium]|jgi:TonB-linked SusC/RagA family outer membrane protein|nr:TonB-dependent receptor [Dysgonamonadaceae bacterium]
MIRKFALKRIAGSLLILFFSGTLLAQNKTVKGTITDNIGELTGVSITVKGTATSVVSDINGRYAITAPGNDAILVFSFIGYSTQEITVDNRTTIDVVMEENAIQLAEVVAIGYGNARKADLSMAVANIPVTQTMKSRPANISSILQGQVAGLTIQFDGGDPLSGQTYNIRGKGSRDSDGILWVVDGIPGAPYNMEDVESVTILKDAASAAIYGASVGSGGVIIITTKQAKTGKVKIDVNLSHNFQQASNLPKVLNSEQLNKVWRDVTGVTGTAMRLPEVFNPSINPYGAVTRTDWLDEIFRTGQVQHYALSLTGGSEILKAFASFAYDKTDGLLINTYKDQLNGKVSIDFQIAKGVKLSQRGTFKYTNGQGGISTGSHESYIVEALGYPPSATVYEYDANGDLVYGSDGNPQYGGTTPHWTGVSGYGSGRNPVASLNRLRQNRPAASIFSTSSLELKPLKALTIKSDYTASLDASRYENFEAKIPELGRPNPENSRYISSAWETQWLWETTATYAELFGKNQISAMAGYIMRAWNHRDNGTTATGYDREDEHSTIFTNATEWTKTKPTESIWNESMISALGRIGYSYDDRYFATASLRYDATSKLAPENNGQIFPAFSALWKISSEPFFQADFINLLKIRGSWGRVGDCSSVPRYSYNAPLGTTTNPGILGKDVNVPVYGVYMETLANRSLIWETTEQTGAGIDVALLNNSLNVSVDYFRKTTKDLIDILPMPSVAGIKRDPSGNVGKVLNTGWEVSANYRKTLGKVNFSVYGNASTVQGEVQDLSPRDLMEHSNYLQSTVGQPWYAYALIPTDGIFQSYDEINSYISPATGNLIQPNARPGDIKFIDYNNDGEINNNDKKFMGSYLPSLTYALGGTMEYKGFDFSFYFQGIAGVKIYNLFRQNAYLNGAAGSNMFTDILNAWNYNTQSGNPRISWLDDDNHNYINASDFYLENGDYLRLKNLTLGYTLPKSLLQNTGIANANIRVYAGAENLLTFTRYTGFDPEVGNHGVDGGAYPVARTFIFGLNVNF